jgi:hypothetical protein
MALANNGITITVTAATMMPGMLRDFVAYQRGAGFVCDVHRQHNEGRSNDSQRGPLKRHSRF